MFDSARITHDFGAAAPSYDHHASLQQQLLRQLLGAARPFMNTTMHILDAGCATGQLAREMPDSHITQIDNAYEMCRAAKPYAPVTLASVEALPFASGSFDMVFSSLVLQWVPEWRQAISEMKRVLKPGGVLALSLFGEGTLAELQQSFATIDRFPHISPFISRAELEQVIGPVQSERIVEHVPNLAHLMQHLKGIGASNKLSARRKSLTTPRQMREVEAHYKAQFGDAHGLSVTWNMLYSVMSV